MSSTVAGGLTGDGVGSRREDTVAHLVDTARTTRIGFVLGLARAGFDLDRQNACGMARARGASPRETLARFQEVEALRSTPPAPLDSRLVEAVVHGEDIRPSRSRRRRERLYARWRQSPGNTAD